MVDLSICVLHYNRWDLTKDCLASIDAQDIPCTYEKVLVDNGSPTVLRTPLPTGWRLVRYEENRGHIAGQNRCFKSTTGKWVLFVANDVRLYPKCIRHLWCNSFRRFGPWRDEWFDMLMPRLLTSEGNRDNDGLLWIWPGYGIANSSERRKWLCSVTPSAFTGSCYLVKRAYWRWLGGFDERLETSHEDIDFCLTARTKGRWPMVARKALAMHLGNATLRNQPSHTRAAFYRDRVYVIRKHYRGFDRWLRLQVVGLLDAVSGFVHRNSHESSRNTRHKGGS